MPSDIVSFFKAVIKVLHKIICACRNFKLNIARILVYIIDMYILIKSFEIAKGRGLMCYTLTGLWSIKICLY